MLLASGPVSTAFADTTASERCVTASLPGSPFVALGHEPGWGLSIDCRSLVLIRDLGRRRQRWQVTPPRYKDGVHVFSLYPEGIEVRVNRVICRDSMTGMPYPTAVTLRTGAQQLSGCGGNPLALLSGRYWRVIVLDGQTPRDPAAIWFKIQESGEVEGSTGCLRFRTSLVVRGEGILFEPVSTTESTCESGRMDQIYRFLRDLQAVRRFDLDEAGSLHLNGDGRTLITAAPLPSGG